MNSPKSAFNAIAGIGEVISLVVSLAAGALWAAIVLRIERNQAALLTGGYVFSTSLTGLSQKLTPVARSLPDTPESGATGVRF